MICQQSRDFFSASWAAKEDVNLQRRLLKKYLRQFGVAIETTYR